MLFAKRYRSIKDGSVDVFLAIRLKSIAMLVVDSISNQQHIINDLIDMQMDTLRGIHEMQHHFTLDLRLIRHDRNDFCIDVCILIKIPAQNQESGMQAAENVGTELLHLLSVNQKYRYFEAVTEQADLDRIIKPFSFNDIVEISRRDANITLDRINQVEQNLLGFQRHHGPAAVLESAGNQKNIYYVFPFSLQLDNLERLCNLMLISDIPCMVSVCLTKYGLSESDIELLEERVRLCEKFSQLRVNIPPSGETIKIEPILQAQAQALLENCSKEYLQYQDAAFLLKIQVAAEQPIPCDLISIVGASITEHSGHPNLPFPKTMNSMFTGGYDAHLATSDVQKKTAQDNLKYLEFTPWIPSRAQATQNHWRYLFCVSQACTAFRLPLPSSHEFPGIDTLQYQSKPAPSDIKKTGLLLGENHHLGISRRIYQDHRDRLRHTYVIGQTGTGKSTLFKSAILQDIQAGHGVGVIDPHGELIDDILKIIPPEREQDVILFDPLDTERPIGLNFVEGQTSLEKDFCINYLMEVFDTLYDLRQTGGPIFEQYMRNALQLLLEQPPSIRATVLDTVKVFQDEDFRYQLLGTCTNPFVIAFWKKEAEMVRGDASLANVSPYITSKLSRFIYNNTLRRIVSQPKSGFQAREVMDKGKILLVDLRKGLLGTTNSHFIGMLLVGKLFTAALSRTDQKDKNGLKEFYLYVDEFHNLATPTFVNILSEARKYKLSLTLTNQFVAQLPREIVHGILGNVGTLISFRVGSEDAELLRKEFSGVVSERDLLGLPNWHTYIRLQSNGMVNAPFDMRTFPSPVVDQPDPTDRIKQASRRRYGRDKDEVDAEIAKMLETIEELARAKGD